jgi:hypothetical protein
MNKNQAIEELVDSLGEKKYSFLSATESNINNYISSRSIGDCLTFIEKRSYGDRSWSPSASVDYVEVLVAFCRGIRYNGHELDSGLTKAVVDIVSKDFENFYEDNGDEVAKSQSEVLLKDKVFLKSLTEEILDIVNSEVPSAIKSKIVTLLLHKFDEVFNTHITQTAAHTISIATTKAVGLAVSLPIAHTTISLIVNFLAMHLKVVLAKILASSAVKTMIATAVKKFVIAAILASIIKFVGAKLSISAGAAFAFILIPVVIGFIIMRL